MKILLDMDGVLADFNTGCFEAHNRPDPYQDPANWGQWNIEEIWGMSLGDFFKPLQVPGFYKNLPLLPGANRLVRALSLEYSEDNIGILSAQITAPTCMNDKWEWIKTYFPQFTSRCFFGREKKFFSAPDYILYDDRDRNVDEFRAGLGEAVLVPQLWNSAHHTKGWWEV